MPYSPVTFDSFGGLDLTNDPWDVGPNRAIDMFDVEITPVGGLRQRDPLVSGTAGLSLTNYHHMDNYDYKQVFYGPSIIGFRTDGVTITINEFEVVGTTYSAYQRGTFTCSSTVSSSATLGTTAVATPAMYIAFSDSFKIRKVTYTGTATWTFPEVGTGRPRWITTSPTDNRLVQARFTDATWSPTGANGSVSAVFFSDPGAPETYTASNWVALRPGDGEEIRGLVTWRDSVVAFKETACFVFFGTSTLSSGIAQFNYRPLTLPGRLQSNVVVGPDGIYFCTAEGVWVTDGIRFRKVSGAIEGVFRLTARDTDYQPQAALTGAPFYGTTFWLSFARDRLYLAFDSVATSWTQLIYDTSLDVWTRHNYRVLHALEAPGENAAIMGGPDIAINQGNITAPGFFYTEPGDSIGAVSPYWRSGWYDLGSQEVKYIRESIAHAGYGTSLGYNLYSDAGTMVASSGSLNASAMGDVYYRTAGKGRRFSHELVGAGDFHVSALTHYVRNSRRVGETV